ncbi:MAG: oligosaccharide flippase family protein [Clostridia bacterium]
MNTRRLLINLIASITSLILSLTISFFLTPFVVNTVGTEAYGFVSLANNFVGYAQIFTLALNSMASRFITIEIHKGDIERANRYFSSIICGNMIMSVILMIPVTIIIVFLEKIVQISPELTGDVKILWALVFANFFIGILTSIYSIATYVTNRLELSSLRTMQSNILKAILLVILFSLFETNIWYIGLVSIICTVFVYLWNLYYQKKLLPEISFDVKLAEKKKVWELIVSGSWNIVTKLGQILTNGLDLLITNLFINATMMGVLAIAQTVPNAFSNLISTVSSVFAPQITINYAKENKSELIKELKRSMKITGFFTNIPLMVFLALGEIFYSLWVPEENVTLLFQLSILIIFGTIVRGVVNSLFNIYTVVNKLKLNSLVTLGMGVLNVIMVFPILYFTDLGIYAIVGVSTVNAAIKNLTFTPINVAHCLGVPKLSFYPIIIRYMFSTVIIGIFCFWVSNVINPTGWLTMILTGVFCGFIGVGINSVILFTKKESKEFFMTIYTKLIKRGTNQY